MLKLFLLLLLVRYAQGQATLLDVHREDPMLDVLIQHGATPATICPLRREEGCAGALWARYWLLVRASCLDDVRVARAPVLLYRGPGDCTHLNGSRVPGELSAMLYFMHPGWMPPMLGEEGEEPGPLDAALVLLSTPAPRTPADNHTATAALLPALSSWLRYIPAQVPWTLDSSPRGPRVLSPLVTSPLRMLLYTIVGPVLALLLGFMLVLRWQEAPESPTDEKQLVDGDELCGAGEAA